MASTDPTPQEIEFGTVARWTREVVERLGPEYAIPAACRGSASPAGLDWLCDRCGLGPGVRLADVGGGTGGPAAYARERTGATPVVVDPMPEACATAEALFGLDTAVGPDPYVPLADASVDACWSLGVLCTVADKAGQLRELRRILRDGGSLGVLVFVADRERPDGAPDGNLFPTLDGAHSLLDAAGLDVRDETALGALPTAPSWWRERADRVDEEMARAHGDDPRYAAADDQSGRLGRLTAAGTVRGHLLHAAARGRTPSGLTVP